MELYELRAILKSRRGAISAIARETGIPQPNVSQVLAGKYGQPGRNTAAARILTAAREMAAKIITPGGDAA